MPWAVPLPGDLEATSRYRPASHAPLPCARPQRIRPSPQAGGHWRGSRGQQVHTPRPTLSVAWAPLCSCGGLYLEVRGALEGRPAHGADVDALTPVGCLAVLQQQAGRGEAAAALQARVQPGLLLGRTAWGQAGRDVRHLQWGRIPTEPLRPGSQTTPDSRHRCSHSSGLFFCLFFFFLRDEKSNRIVQTMQGRHTLQESDRPVTPVPGGHASTQERLCERRKKRQTHLCSAPPTKCISRESV